jgi:hypothetical protein
MSNYKITEQDIEGTLAYLRLYHPVQATREEAISYLEYYKAFYRDVALDNPSKLDKIFEAFQKSKTNKD